MAKTVVVHSLDIVHQGHYPKLVARLTHDRFDGTAQKVSRDLLDLGATATVLPYDPVRDTVVLVEQFRPGPWRLGDDPWLLEAIAGRCDGDEAAAPAARREALEEAGVALESVTLVTAGYPSPGCLAERASIFVGCADLAAVQAFGGHDPGEDIRVHVVPFAEAMAMAADGRLRALTAQVALFWLALNRAELRQRWRRGSPASEPGTSRAPSRP